MKVYDGSLKGAAAEPAQVSETQRVDRATSGQKTGSASSEGGDRVELSSALGSLSRALTSFGTDRASQVRALEAQYQSGQYQVNAAATSRGLVTEALAQGTP